MWRFYHHLRLHQNYQNASFTFDTLLWTTFYPYTDEITEKKLLGRFCEITKLPLPLEWYLEATEPYNEQEWPEKKVWYYWDIKSYLANEFCFHGKKQIRIKVYLISEGKEELIEHIRTTLNPFLLNSKASRKAINLVEFKQQ